jgi:DNA-3-methyladenine glycosylase II
MEEKALLSSERFNVYPTPPYDFDLSCSVFEFEKPMPELYESRVWRRALRLNSDKLIPVALRSLGTIEEPKIEIQCFSSVSEEEKSELAAKLDWMFSFSEDLTDLYAFMERDPILKDVKKKLYGLKAGSMGATVFESVVKTILQQQISLRVSFWMTNRLVTKFGENVKANGRVYYDFPTANALAEASLEETRQCGLSLRKSEYIKGIAEKVVKGEFDPEGLKKLSNEEVIEELKEFRGLGKWSAELVLCTGLKRKDVIPADDLGVRRTISKFYFNDKNISGDEVRKLTEKWGALKRDIIFYLICMERSTK